MNRTEVTTEGLVRNSSRSGMAATALFTAARLSGQPAGYFFASARMIMVSARFLTGFSLLFWRFWQAHDMGSTGTSGLLAIILLDWVVGCCFPPV